MKICLVLMALLSFYGVYRLLYQHNRMTLNYIRIVQLFLIVISVWIMDDAAYDGEERRWTTSFDYLSLFGFTAYFFFSKHLRERYS